MRSKGIVVFSSGEDVQRNVTLLFDEQQKFTITFCPMLTNKLYVDGEQSWFLILSLILSGPSYQLGRMFLSSTKYIRTFCNATKAIPMS